MIRKVWITMFFLVFIFTCKTFILASESTNAIPIPVISGPTMINAGEIYQFSGQLSSDPDGSIVKYEWYASGALPVTSISISQTFFWTMTGTRTIFLKVTDDKGATKQIYQTLEISDAKPAMTGINHYLDKKVIAIGETSSLIVQNCPEGASVSFFNDGGLGEVEIMQKDKTAFLKGIKSGGKRIGYIVTHPDHAAYRGSVEFNIILSDLEMMSILWYSPAMNYEEGKVIDIYISGAPQNSIYSFENITPGIFSINEIQENRCRIELDSSGVAYLQYKVTCVGYYDRTDTIKINISEDVLPVAVISSINNGYTGEKYYFSASEAEQYEWKWHSSENMVLASTTRSFFKQWKADQYGIYNIYLRVMREGVWSKWMSKTIQIKKGISFDADTIYAGTHNITDEEWQYIRQKIGSGYEKAYSINGKMYLFNVELFQDKNIIVYGDHTLNGSSMNPFTGGSEIIPYFIRNGVKGEYKYLGYIFGTETPFTNQNYKAANQLILEGVNRNAEIIRISELPYSVKENWGISNSTNEGFRELKEEINSSDSYDFSNNNSSNHPKPLYLKTGFDLNGLSFDPYEYGIVNFFDKYLGGSIRIFFRYFDGGYDWRTFEGSIDSEKQCPEILVSDNIQRNHTVNSEDEIIVNGEIHMSVFDNNENNSLYSTSAYFYDRDDSHAISLDMTSENSLTALTVSNPLITEYFDDYFIVKKNIKIVVQKNDLSKGLNEFVFDVTGSISFAENAGREKSYPVKVIINNYHSNDPFVETLGVFYVDSYSAKLGLKIHDIGDPAAEEAGIVIYKNSYERDIPIEEVVGGEFSVSISELIPNTVYKYKAYIKQGIDEFFGEEKTFLTSKIQRNAPQKPIVTDITDHSAYIFSDSGAYIVCNGEEKISGSFFYGLNENSLYETFAYFKENLTYQRSDISEMAYFRTLETLYILPDKYIYVGERILIDDVESIELIEGSEYISTDGKEILGVSEGVALLKGRKELKECIFEVNVLPIGEKDTQEEENKIVDFRITRIYDPDFVDIIDINYLGMPVFEHIDSGMIDLGYLVTCEMVFLKDEMPEIPEIRTFDENGDECLSYVFNDQIYEIFELKIENHEYQDNTLSFDLYIPPHVKFFGVDVIVDVNSIQMANEVLLCLVTDTKTAFDYSNKEEHIITKEITSDLLQVFWYNLRRNCYDDLSYEKGR